MEETTTGFKILRLQLKTDLFKRFSRICDMPMQEQVTFLIQDFVELKEMLESETLEELENGN